MLLSLLSVLTFSPFESLTDNTTMSASLSLSVAFALPALLLLLLFSLLVVEQSSQSLQSLLLLSLLLLLLLPLPPLLRPRFAEIVLLTCGLMTRRTSLAEPVLLVGFVVDAMACCCCFVLFLSLSWWCFCVGVFL